MGSDETATATTGGPRVIDVFDGNGAPSGPNYTLFQGQISSWRPLEVGLVVGKRLCRIRRQRGSLVLSASSGKQTLAKAAKAARAAERNRLKLLEAAAYTT